MPIKIEQSTLDGDFGYGLERLESFLNQIHKAGLLEKVNDTGLVLIADDQFVNRQAIELVVEDLGIKDRTRIFENG